MAELPYNQCGIGNDDAMSRSERVTLLFEEMKRISDPYHRAIDNYYKVVTLATSVVAVVASVAGKLGAEKFLALVPFLCLAVILVESQIRTTIMCASKYLALLEVRINAVAGFEALLYEQRLSLGITLYYAKGQNLRYKRMRFSSFIIFFWVIFLVFAGSLANFLAQVSEPHRPRLFYMRTEIAVAVYLFILALCVAITVWSWFGLFNFADNVYPDLLERRFIDQTLDNSVSNRGFSAKVQEALQKAGKASDVATSLVTSEADVE